MPRRANKVDLPAILRDPAAVFKSPRDVLDHPNLTRADRLAILEQWERDARGLSVAEEEGMAGGEENLLARVRAAIVQLELGPQRSPRGPSTKYG